jgi:hypothetical protein
MLRSVLVSDTEASAAALWAASARLRGVEWTVLQEPTYDPSAVRTLDIRSHT